jgi:hypothetical protein
LPGNLAGPVGKPRHPHRADRHGQSGVRSQRGQGGQYRAQPRSLGDLARGALVESTPRRRLQFEAAIRETEHDPLVLELACRASLLHIDP